MTTDQLTEARRLCAEDVPFREIGRRVGLSHTTVIKHLDDSTRCSECDTKLAEDRGSSLCGLCVEQAVFELGESRPASTFAVFRLREIGCSAAAVVRAVRDARAGVPLAEIRDALLPGVAG
ncbi:MAG TPA: hypothetical protein VMS11_03365 [Solirubrobacterales bacterium]|nr:hypothetical protein [Solirubrobacterales bacterium]